MDIAQLILITSTCASWDRRSGNIIFGVVTMILMRQNDARWIQTYFSQKSLYHKTPAAWLRCHIHLKWCFLKMFPESASQNFGQLKIRFPDEARIPACTTQVSQTSVERLSVHRLINVSNFSLRRAMFLHFFYIGHARFNQGNQQQSMLVQRLYVYRY